MYKCDKCQDIFDKPSHYKYHMARKRDCTIYVYRKTTIKEGEIFPCKHCPQQFKHKYLMQNHIRLGRCKKNNQIDNNSNLINNIPPSPSICIANLDTCRVCPYCGIQYTCNDALKIHLDNCSKKITAIDFNNDDITINSDTLNIYIDRNPDILNVLYIVTTPYLLENKMFKIGRHHGTFSKLSSRYRTYLIFPLILYFVPFNNYVKAEELLKSRLEKYRVLNDNDRLSEWVNIDYSVIIDNINYVVAVDSNNYSK
jgi:hypothetical protein